MCIYIYVYVSNNRCVRVSYVIHKTCVYMYIYIYTYMYVYVNVYVYVYIYICIYMYIYIYVCVCALCCVILLDGFCYMMLYHIVFYPSINNQHQSPFGGQSKNMARKVSIFGECILVCQVSAQFPTTETSRRLLLTAASFNPNPSRGYTLQNISLAICPAKA